MYVYYYYSSETSTSSFTLSLKPYKPGIFHSLSFYLSNLLSTLEKIICHFICRFTVTVEQYIERVYLLQNDHNI